MSASLIFTLLYAQKKKCFELLNSFDCASAFETKQTTSFFFFPLIQFSCQNNGASASEQLSPGGENDLLLSPSHHERRFHNEKHSGTLFSFSPNDNKTKHLISASKRRKAPTWTKNKRLVRRERRKHEDFWFLPTRMQTECLLPDPWLPKLRKPLR